MSFQELAFQTGSGERTFQLTLVNDLTLGVSGEMTATRTLTISESVSLVSDSVLDLGGPTGLVIRFRVFLSKPRSFPILSPGVNEPLAEPVIFFHKDAQVNLDFTILNPDGSAYNLTGVTAVDLLAQPERGAAVSFSCSVIDAANGLARRTVSAGDFESGPYQAQIRVTAGGLVFHTPYFRILVSKAIVP